jgi:two-component system chemotaxis sensor kinase CheA
VRRGLVDAEDAGRMTARELVSLIFAPGFSTAETVTSVSGRGVGMDVVRTNIESVGGVIDVESRAGEGTTIRIKIPLTLAIIPALIATSAGERYAIPQANVLELVRIEAEDAGRAVERIHGVLVHRLRGMLVPLVHLGRELGLERAGEGSGALNIVVLDADGRRFGLVVDAVGDTAEVVVKPLARQLHGLPTFSGATILGDGRVALILDVLGLARRAHVVSDVRDRARPDGTARVAPRIEVRHPLLVLAAGDGRRLAIPLSTVTRLEEFPRHAIERAGSREVVQYRGGILPLVRLADVVGGGVDGAVDRVHVVVWTARGRSIGLIVDRIVDVVEEAVAVERGSGRPGVLGSAIVQRRVTELLDVPAIVRAVDPAFSDDAAA